MNPKINRSFLETLSAYLERTTDVESDRLFKAKMEEMDGESVRATLESVMARWQSLPKARRIALAGVEQIDQRSRLSADAVAAVLASTAPLPTIAPGIRSKLFDTKLSLMANLSGPHLTSRESVMDDLYALAGGQGSTHPPPPPKPNAKYKVDWAGAYCEEETWGLGADEVYVIFTMLQAFRKPWTLRSNIEEDWDSGDDWGPFPAMSLFGEKGTEQPAETAFTATVMEHDYGDPDKYRDEIHAIATAAQAYAAYKKIPIPDVAVEIVTDIINGLLDTGDDHLGTQTVVIGPATMMWLAQQPLTHFLIQLNYHFFSTHTGGGAIYHVFYQVIQESNGPAFKWTKIGGKAKELYAGGAGLFATSPDSGDIYRFNGKAKPWTKVGGPGADFAVTHHDLFGLSPDRSAVYRMVSPGKWEKVGGYTFRLVGGGATLYAQTGLLGAIRQYGGSPNKWTKIGGPGFMFVANDQTVYGLTPNRGGVYEYLGSPGKWKAIGGTALEIVAGGPYLFAISVEGDIWRYEGQPFKWTKVGEPGQSFAACDAGVFGLAPNKSGVWWHLGPPDQWVSVRGPTGSIAASGLHLYATSPNFKGVYMLEL